MGLPATLAIMAGIAVGAACGFVNGFLVTRFRLPPFIVDARNREHLLRAEPLVLRQRDDRAQDIEEKGAAPDLLRAGV